MSEIDLSPAALEVTLSRYQDLFACADVEAILKDFAEDVRVEFGPFMRFTGKKKLRQLLQKRFAAMEGYQLIKRLELVNPPRFAASWRGSWIDTTTGVRMESFGLEVLTVRNGKFCEWQAGLSTWRAGAALQV